METVFSVGSVPRLYNEDPMPPPSTMQLIYFHRLLHTFTTCFGRMWPSSGVLLPKTLSLCVYSTCEEYVNATGRLNKVGYTSQ
jgi:hypothetical protein